MSHRQKKTDYDRDDFMPGLTLALAILLAAGIFFAEVGKRLRLPSVTGYIVAGLILGHSGFDVFGGQDISLRLGHFTQIALMLIAFSIGEQIEIKEIRSYFKSVGIIGLFETAGAFVAVTFSSLLVILLFMRMPPPWGMKDTLCLAILLGAVSVATAPAATLHVMKELGARGPLTKTLLAVVAVDDGLAIMFFSIGMSIVNQMLGAGDAGMAMAVVKSLAEIMGSIIMGVITGITIDYVIKYFDRKNEMLTAGLALLLLTGEFARLTHLSPLLAGMAAGFTVINRDARDVRLFNALQEFGPPVYVLFFTLAGAHLDLSILKTAGLLGLAYFFSRIVGKIAGAALGARLASSPVAVQKYLGFALVPQAGVAIGLIFLIGGDPALARFSAFITPVVLAGVVLSELFGPVAARYAVESAGEARLPRHAEGDRNEKETGGHNDIIIAPWDLPPMLPVTRISGAVIFGASNPVMARGLARVAIILAQHFKSSPVSVRVFSEKGAGRASELLHENFRPEKAEGRHLNCDIQTFPVSGMKVADGLVRAINEHDTRCVILGYPVKGTIQKFQKVVEKVARDANCPVIVVRFAGTFSINRVLVPVTGFGQLDALREVIEAFHMVRGSILTLMYMLPYDSQDSEIAPARERLINWARENNITSLVKCQVIQSESRAMSIVEESVNHSLILMSSPRRSQLHSIFFRFAHKDRGTAEQETACDCKQS